MQEKNSGNLKWYVQHPVTFTSVHITGVIFLHVLNFHVPRILTACLKIVNNIMSERPKYHSNASHLLFPSLQEARETGALKEAKDKLEKKVEELTWRVQLEKRLRVLFWTTLFHL